MKLIYSAVLILFITSCKTQPKIELTVKAPGIRNGVIILKQANEIALSQNIKDGEMAVSLQLAAPGYYSLTILDTDKPLSANQAFDVYLGPDKYLIETDIRHLKNYPKITTGSEIQNQLTDYYHYSDGRTHSLDNRIDSLKTFLESQEAPALPARKRAIIYADTRSFQKKRRELELDILKTYTNNHPQSKIGAHIMAGQYYPENAAAYNEIFQKFRADVKNSDDGLKISNKLRTLLGVMAGATAPDIVGNMPNSIAFSKSEINNKITLIEFWRSSHKVSSFQHVKMLNGIIVSDYDRKKFGIISISLDTSAMEWKRAIKQDGLNWTQVSDLKGDNSPNVSNWNITQLPAFFLVDQNWRIIKSNVDFVDIDSEVHEYLKKR